MVLVVVMVTKTVLSRRVATIGEEIVSRAVRADAWNHLSDPLTSAGLCRHSLAVVGGVGWE